MGTIDVGKVGSEAEIFGKFNVFRKCFKGSQRAYRNYEELYKELLSCRQNLQELYSAYKQVLNNTNLENLKDIVEELSLIQGIYYAALLRLYENRLDYVDVYSLHQITGKSRRTIEKFLTGAKDSKSWRRGSPRIAEICEKSYLKVKRKKVRRVACFKPIGFFEFLSRFCRQISSTLLIVEKLNTEILKKTTLDLTIVEYWLNLVSYIDKVSSEKVEIPPEFTDFSVFLSEIGKKEKEFPEKELGKLKKAFNDFRDLFKAMENGKKLMREYVQGIDVDKLQRYKNDAEFILDNRRKTLKILKSLKREYESHGCDMIFLIFKGTLDSNIFQNFLEIADNVNSAASYLLQFLDNSIFEFKLDEACSISSNMGASPFLELKRELDNKLKSHLLDGETYKKRVEKLSQTVEELVRERIEISQLLGERALNYIKRNQFDIIQP